MKRILYILIWCCAANAAGAVVYDNVKLVPNPKTADRNAFVSNPDKILSSETVATLNADLNALEGKTGAEVAVVALNSIGAEDIEGFANELFKHWGVGKAGKDNGLLLLFVLDQRKVRFEVGYGLEGLLPDAICKRIQIQKMIPEFKNGNYDAGILAGVRAAETYIRKEEPAEMQENSGIFDTLKDKIFDLLLVTAIITFLLILITYLPASSLAKKLEKDTTLNNQERYKQFSVLKASKYSGCIVPALAVAVFLYVMPIYLVSLVLSLIITALVLSSYEQKKKKAFRYQPILCTHCNKIMRLLSEEEDNRYLSAPESAEDELQSVDADVFLCDSCHRKTVFRYENKSSKYKDCPHCGTKALYFVEKNTIRPATYISGGLEKETYSCKYCRRTVIKNITSPRLQRSAAVVPIGGFGRGGGGFSGGGSFGGGFSGGGGSTSSW
ncbi:MAG: TPM domain-containing protein [Prevotellaceae bacterium]|jgi:uncharacterized protein|nr:TPM domain-containing protein [Prevotellaceae bacterium]